MRKRSRINETEGIVFGLIWFKKKLQIKTSKLSKLLKIDYYDVRKALNNLHKNRWIYKRNCGRNGLELSLRKVDIPKYVEKIIEKKLLLYFKTIKGGI
ncbi:MAG: hypothetical protein GX334_04200 [Firmicutes bacterium]|nr:hypothetical protein [Bacillota bacterium]